jgi:hypothetical protein
MARFARKGLMAALEEAAEGVEVVNSVDELNETNAEIIDGVQEIADGDEACGEEVAAIESLVVAIEEVLDEAESIEEVIDTVQEVATDENGEEEGLTEEEAALAEESLRVIYRRLGIPMHNVMPATEGFRTKSTRVSSTQVAVEGMMDTIKKIWESVSSSITRVAHRFSDFLKNSATTNKSIAKTAAKLKEKIAILRSNGAVAKVAEFEDKALYRRFLDGKPVDAAGVRQLLTNHTGQTTLAQKALDVIKETEKAVKLEGELSVERIEKLIEDIVKFAVKNVTGEALSVELDGEEHAATSKYRLVDARHFVASYSVNMNEEAREYKYRFRVELEEAEDVDKETRPVVVAKLDELSALCDALIAFSKLNESTFARFMSADKMIGQGIMFYPKQKAVVRNAAAQDEEFSKGNSKLVRLLAEVVTLTNVSMIRYATKAIDENFTAARAVISYISRCTNQYDVSGGNSVESGASA